MQNSDCIHDFFFQPLLPLRPAFPSKAVSESASNWTQTTEPQSKQMPQPQFQLSTEPQNRLNKPKNLPPPLLSMEPLNKPTNLPLLPTEAPCLMLNLPLSKPRLPTPADARARCYFDLVQFVLNYVVHFIDC